MLWVVATTPWLLAVDLHGVCWVVGEFLCDPFVYSCLFNKNITESPTTSPVLANNEKDT